MCKFSQTYDLRPILLHKAFLKQKKFVQKANTQQIKIIWSNVGHYRKTSNISRTLVSNKIVDNSDVVGASPVGAAPTTSSFST